MKIVLAMASLAVSSAISGAHASTVPDGIKLAPSDIVTVQYRSRYYGGARIRTFPSGQRYTSRGGPYIKLIGPGGLRTGPIGRHANGG